MAFMPTMACRLSGPQGCVHNQCKCIKYARCGLLAHPNSAAVVETPGMPFQAFAADMCFGNTLAEPSGLFACDLVCGYAADFLMALTTRVPRPSALLFCSMMLFKIP